MPRQRRPSRLPLIRFIARLAPVIAVSILAAALWLDGRWPLIAAGVSALLTVLLAALVVQVDRRRRVEVGATRARIAADYADEHARYAAEHRAFTAHLVELLDAASRRIGLLRHRVDWLESELSAVRRMVEHQATPPPPAQQARLAELPDASEWNELWPDLAEAPTVVDLVAWDEQNSELIAPYQDDSDEEQPQQRSA